MKIRKTLVYSLCLVLLCRVLFDACYGVLSPLFSYAGLIMEGTHIDYIMSWIIFAIYMPYIAWLNCSATKMSDFVMLFLGLLAFIPFTTMIGLRGFPIGFVVYGTVFWSVLFVGNIILTSEKSKYMLTSIFSLADESQKHLLWIIVFLAVAVILYVSGRYRHFAVNFNLDLVYEIRAAASEFGLSTLISYLISMASIVILLSVLYFLYVGKYKIALLFIGIQLLNFGIASHKSILLQLVLAILIFLFYDRLLKNKLVFYMDVLLSFGIGETLFLKSNLINVIIIRRACFVPNLLSSQHYDFFSTHTPDYFAQSFLRYFGVRSAYPRNIAFMIGDLYYNKPFMSANNGLIADAITNFGVAGAVLFPLLVCVLLMIFNKASKNLPPKIYIMLSLSVATGLQNTFLMTCLLTHGFLIMLLCLYFMSENIEHDYMLKTEM